MNNGCFRIIIVKAK